jgi:hypothetical protein
VAVFLLLCFEQELVAIPLLPLVDQQCRRPTPQVRSQDLVHHQKKMIIFYNSLALNILKNNQPKTRALEKEASFCESSV